MGAIGRELIRRSQERIIQMERHLEWLRSRGGYAREIAETERALRDEHAALAAKSKLESGEQ